MRCPACDHDPTEWIVGDITVDVCEGGRMMRHFFRMNRGVEVDECPSCGGDWLDCGELGRIREQFPADAEVEKATAACFPEIFGGELETMRRESGEKLKKARKIARMFRFICPSYYIPWKQNGGAFWPIPRASACPAGGPPALYQRSRSW